MATAHVLRVIPRPYVGVKTSLRRIVIALFVSAAVLGVGAAGAAVSASSYSAAAPMVVIPSERTTPAGQAALTEASAMLREASSVMDVSSAAARIDRMWARDPFRISIAKETVQPVADQLANAKAIQAAIAEASAAVDDAKTVSVDSSSIVLPRFTGALPTPEEVASTDVTPLRDATAALIRATQEEKNRLATEAEAAAQSGSTYDEGFQEESDGGGYSAPSGDGYASAYINVVCTAPNGEGMQETVDACSPGGWVQMSYISSVPVIARHVNYGGGSILSLSSGDIVEVGGSRFVVIGAADIPQDATQAAVDAYAPGGSVLALQTCNWGGGPMRFVYLARA